MITLPVAEVAENLDRILSEVETCQEEIVLTRDDRVIARLIPEPRPLNALEVLGDLHHSLDDDAAGALSAGVEKSRGCFPGSLQELRNPWGS